ncbi:methyltransferase [Actinophytocola sediminis]
MGVVDAIPDEGRSSAEVARALDLHADATLRLLRALAAVGVLRETEPGTFAVTTMGELLRGGHAAAAPAFTEFFTDPMCTRPWENLAHTVRTGKPEFDELFGKPFFAGIRAHNELSALFDASMSQETQAVNVAVARTFDFGRFSTMLDIGGGDGKLLESVLLAHPALRGVVFDSAEGGARATARFAENGLADRALVETGDFLAALPGGADLYCAKSVLHDWDDERAATILRNCRAVIPADGRLLVVEYVLPPAVDGEVPDHYYLSDLNLMVLTGGRERTKAEFEQLFATTGFALVDITPLDVDTRYSCLVARPV